MRNISFYPLDGSGPTLNSISPIPKREPTSGFNAAADKNNPTNTPTMDENGLLTHPWQIAAPGYVPGTNKIQTGTPPSNAPSGPPPGFANMTRWGPYTPEMQNPGWMPSDPELRKQFIAAGGWDGKLTGAQPVQSTYKKNLKKYGIF